MKLKLVEKLLICFIFLLAFSSCKQGKEKTEKNNLNTIVEVTTTGMDFEMVDTLNSGWTTFKYINNSFEPHFFILEKMPDSIGFTNYENELIPPFKNAFQFFNEGKIEEGMKEFEKIPHWFSKVELSGGVGLTSPKTTSISSVYLQPGTYVMECYVRMPNGQPHTFMGMVKEVTVLNTPNKLPKPAADFDINISSEKGITFKDSIEAGKYTLSVNFKDQKKYEHWLGHDINLVKIENDSFINRQET